MVPIRALRRSRDGQHSDSGADQLTGVSGEARSGWRSRLGLLLGASLITFLALALVGEATVRYRERHSRTVPGTMPLLYYRHARLRHALVRNLDYYGWVHVNSAGFRGPEVPLQKKPGTVRIMAVGGSTTFDGEVTGDERAWPARLEHWLRTLAPDLQVEVINAGVSGYHVLDNQIRLQTQLYAYQPDVFILYEGHNDLVAALGGSPGQSTTDTPDELPVETPWTHWLTRHSLLYNKVILRFKALLQARRATGEPPGGAPAVDLQARLRAGADQFTRDLASLVLVAKNVPARVIVLGLAHVSGAGALVEPDSVTRISWRHGFPFAAAESVLQAYMAYDSVAQTTSRGYGATYVSIRPFNLHGRGLFADGDPIHFNDEGANLMGHRLAEALLATGLLAPAREKHPHGNQETSAAVRP